MTPRGSFAAVPVLPAALTVAVLLAACGSSADVCVELREPEDRQSGLHVISEEVAYSTDPPTSGPHWAVEAPTGLQEESLPRPVQVRILEGGGVVVQTSDAEALAELAPLAGDRLVVAPGPDDLDALVVAPGPDDLEALVVATAWTWKLECSAVDLDAVRAFADERRRFAPGLD